MELPNLIEVQTSSFQWFIETLMELFEDFTHQNFTESLELYFNEYELEPAKWQSSAKTRMTFPDCSRLGSVKSKELPTATGQVAAETIKEQKIFMGDIPMMTPLGSFIINGSERVIVSQIVRSAGVFFSEEVDKKTLQRKYLGQVIPTRGAWLEYEIGSRDILYAKIDRSKKIPLSILIRAIGLSKNEQIYKLFGEHRCSKHSRKR